MHRTRLSVNEPPTRAFIACAACGRRHSTPRCATCMPPLGPRSVVQANRPTRTTRVRPQSSSVTPLTLAPPPPPLHGGPTHAPNLISHLEENVVLQYLQSLAHGTRPSLYLVRCVVRCASLLSNVFEAGRPCLSCASDPFPARSPPIHPRSRAAPRWQSSRGCRSAQRSMTKTIARTIVSLFELCATTRMFSPPRRASTTTWCTSAQWSPCGCVKTLQLSQSHSSSCSPSPPWNFLTHFSPHLSPCFSLTGDVLPDA